MKTIINFFSYFFAFAIAVTVWNFNISSNERGLPDVSLANIEALANNENSGDDKECFLGYLDNSLEFTPKEYWCGDRKSVV